MKLKLQNPRLKPGRNCLSIYELYKFLKSYILNSKSPMSLQIGLVGMPNVGKSTLFNALTRSSGAETANYPFCTIDPNVGVVEVPDERLNQLAKIMQSEKAIPATVEFVDIAGLVKGASTGEGLGNKFLSHIRECAAIAQVVRVFEDPDIIHVNGKINPHSDIETIHTELILADLQSLEKQIGRLEKETRGGSKEAKITLILAEKIKIALDQGMLANELEFTSEEKNLARALHLLTNKPIIFVANIKEAELKNLNKEALREKLGKYKDAKIIPICAKVEADLAAFSDEEAAELLKELELKESGLKQLIREAYDVLDLHTFFTAGPKETRAWTLRKNSSAPQAAGVIHTDFEKGFIRAEVIAFSDFIEHSGESGAREKGKLRLEGKDYTIADGDVCHFRFNV